MAGRKPTVEDEDILRQFALSADPILTTAELADTFDMSTQGMGKRLRSLLNDGYVRRKKVGRAHAWWLSRKGRKVVEEEARSGYSSGSE